MAVPKNKRYKQVVRTRRSLQKRNLLLNKNLIVNKFSNYIKVALNYTELNDVKCLFCKDKQITRQLCVQCYNYWFTFSFFNQKDDNFYYDTGWWILDFYAAFSKKLHPINWVKSVARH